MKHGDTVSIAGQIHAVTAMEMLAQCHGRQSCIDRSSAGRTRSGAAPVMEASPKSKLRAIDIVRDGAVSLQHRRRGHSSSDISYDNPAHGTVITVMGEQTERWDFAAEGEVERRIDAHSGFAGRLLAQRPRGQLLSSALRPTHMAGMVLTAVTLRHNAYGNMPSRMHDGHLSQQQRRKPSYEQASKRAADDDLEHRHCQRVCRPLMVLRVVGAAWRVCFVHCVQRQRCKGRLDCRLRDKEWTSL